MRIEPPSAYSTKLKMHLNNKRLHQSNWTTSNMKQYQSSQSLLLLTLLSFLCTLNYHRVQTSPADTSRPQESVDGPQLRIFPNSSPNQAPSGNPFLLTCKGLQAHPSLFNDLKWEDPRGQIINKNVRLAGGSLLLQFDKPTMEDSGEYTCKGSFQQSTMLSAKTRVEFFNEITMECPERQYITEGSTDQTILCKVSAQPAPDVEWTKEDKPFSEYPGRYTYQDGLIKINLPVNKEDGGKYTVTATVKDTGRMKIREIYTEVYTEPKIVTNDKNQEHYLGIKSEGIELSCQASGYPTPRISWFDPSRRNLSSEGGYIVNPETGNLKITNLKIGDNGTFECAAHNPVGMAKTKINLFVGVKPEILNFENKTVDENGNVDLECRSYGIPSPKIEIRSNKQQSLAFGQEHVEKIETFVEGDTTLLRVKLVGVPKNFDSIYYCRSENYAGSVERSGQLKVRFAPDLSGTPRRQWIKSSKTPVATCFVRAFPEPRISWSRDGFALTGQEYEMSVDPSQNTHSLTIKPQSLPGGRGPFGNYLCTATNSVGQNTQLIELLEAKPPSSIQYTDIEAYPTHARVTISAPDNDGGLLIKNYHIFYEGQPNPTYSGSTHFGNQSFPFMIQDKNTRRSGPYVLNNLRPNYSYRLKVYAENDAGRSEGSIEYVLFTPSARAPDAPIIIDLDHPTIHTIIPKIAKSKFSDGYKLTWSPPTYNNGEPIDHYKIRYYEVQYSNAQWDRVGNSNDVEIIHDKSRSERADIRDLKPNTHYQIEVRAHNREGISAPANIVILTLPFGGPSLNNSDDYTASFLFDLSPSNGLILLIIFVLIIILILVDVTCCCKYQVGALSIIRSWCCSTDQKGMIRETTYP